MPKRKLLPEDTTPIGYVTHVLRERNGWSLAELGRRADLSPGALGDVESGRTGRPDRLDKLAKALGTTPERMEAGIVDGKEMPPRDMGPVFGPETDEILRSLTEKKRQHLETQLLRLLARDKD